MTIFTSSLQCYYIIDNCGKLPSACKIKDANLLELNFGEWELKKWSEIPKNLLDQWSADFVNYRPSVTFNLSQFA